MWQAVGVVVTVATLVVSTLYLLRWQRKALSYEVVHEAPIFAPEGEIHGKFRLLFEGVAVERVALVIVRLSNTGNTPLVAQDYERPVALDFGLGSRVLAADVLETTPHNLQARFDIQGNKVVMSPMLLNSGDSVTFKTLVGEPRRPLAVDGRIVGVKAIREFQEGRLTSVAVIVGMASSLVFLLASLLLLFKAQTESVAPRPWLVAFLLLTIGTMVYAATNLFVTMPWFWRRRSFPRSRGGRW